MRQRKREMARLRWLVCRNMLTRSHHLHAMEGPRMRLRSNAHLFWILDIISTARVLVQDLWLKDLKWSETTCDQNPTSSFLSVNVEGGTPTRRKLSKR